MPKTDFAIPQVTVGMGCTVRIGSDAYTYTIIQLSATGKTGKIQGRHAWCISGGMSESQEWETSPNPHGEIEKIYLGHEDGLWHISNENRWQPRYVVNMGVLRPYRDPSF